MRSRGVWRVVLPACAVVTLLAGLEVARSSATAAAMLPRQIKVVPAVSSREDRSFPTVQRGQLVSFVRTVAQSRTAAIQTTSLDTGQVSSVDLQLPGARELRIESVAVGSNGHLFVSGFFSTDPAALDVGTIARSRASADVLSAADIDKTHNFIVEMVSGRVVSRIELGAYTAERMCVDGSGGIWTFGQQWADEIRHATRNYPLVRHYSPSGHEENGGPLLQRSDLTSLTFMPKRGVRAGELANYHNAPATGGSAFLACGDESVAVLVRTSPTIFVWWERALQSDTAVKELVRSPKGLVPTGMALLGRGEAYASFGVLTHDVTPSRWFAAPVGLYRLDLQNPVMATWNRADAATDEGSTFSVLLGRDGRSLVHLRGTTPPRSDPTLFWTDVPAAQ